MFFRIKLLTQPIRQTNICVHVCVCVCVCVRYQVPSRGLRRQIKAPAKCFLFRIPYRRLWRQKRQPNVSYLESRAGGCGDKKRRPNVSSHLCPRSMWQTNICMDEYILKSSKPGVMATKAPAISFLYRIPYGMLWRQKRRPNASSDLCTHTHPMRQTNVCMNVCII